MEQGTATRPQEQDPAEALPAGSPEGLKKAARGGKASTVEEAGALDFLLGPTTALQFEVPVQLDTDKGRKELTFVIQQMDGDRIIKLEDDHREGSGPFAELDDVGFNAALVAEGTVVIRDTTGRETAPDEAEFIGGAVTPADAMKARFKKQSGLLAGLAGEIRRVSGYEPKRVGQAEAPIRDAVGGS
jgi:hypothetical protein